MNSVKRFPDIYNAVIYYYSKSEDRMQANIVIFTSLVKKKKTTLVLKGPMCKIPQRMLFSAGWPSENQIFHKSLYKYLVLDLNLNNISEIEIIFFRLQTHKFQF